MVLLDQVIQIFYLSYQYRYQNPYHHNRLKNSDGTEKEVLLLKERYAEQSKKAQELTQSLEQKEQRLIDTHSQLAALNQKIHELALKVSAADDIIERLRYEKLFLAQEKSELVGQVRQLEKNALC